MSSSRQTDDEAKGRKDGTLRQIRDDAQPSEKGLLRRIETGGGQTVPQGLPFEIDWSEGERMGNGDPRFSEPLLFPSLSCRVIHLEDEQIFSQGGPVSISIQACPKHNQLTGAACDGSGQGVLGKARSHCNEQA